MKRHNRKKRYTNPRVLILCEGETECRYFKGILQDESYKNQLSSVRTSVFTGNHPSPDKLILEAKNRLDEAKKEGNPFKETWVIFDHDLHPNRKEAYKLAKKFQINIGFSAIAFEQWFLLHFSKSSRPFLTPSALIRELIKFYPAYSKAKNNDFAYLKDKLEIALKNTRWLKAIKLKEEIPIFDLNPWIDLDVLVEKMIAGSF